MVRAAGLVEGEHDFTSFAAVDLERSAGVALASATRENARHAKEFRSRTSGGFFLRPGSVAETSSSIP